MSILRVFPGRNDKEARLRYLLSYVGSDHGKTCWQGRYFAQNPNMVRGFGLPEQASVEDIFSAMILPHIAYGYPGRRLCYHCLIDFNGILGPSDAGAVAWDINRFLQAYGVQYLQGVHVTKDNGHCYWPHVHVLINTIRLSGPRQGRKFRLEKPVLRSYMEYMNHVLKRYSLPEIPIYKKELK